MILVIDRDPDLCDTLKEVLQSEGYKVDCARSMELARPLLRKNKYRVILIEHLLFSPTDKFQGQGKVVIMTGLSNYTSALQRPFTIETLLNTVHTN